MQSLAQSKSNNVGVCVIQHCSSLLPKTLQVFPGMDTMAKILVSVGATVGSLILSVPVCDTSSLHPHSHTPCPTSSQNRLLGFPAFWSLPLQFLPPMQSCSSPSCERNPNHPSKPSSPMESLLIPSMGPSHGHPSHFLGAWSWTQSLPCSAGGKDKGASVSTMQHSQPWQGSHGRREGPVGLGHWLHRAWPQLPRSWLPRSATLTWVSSPSLRTTWGVAHPRQRTGASLLAAPTSSRPSQGSFKPQIRPCLPQLRASLYLCGQAPHTSPCLMGAPALFPPWAPWARSPLRKSQGSKTHL